MKLFYSPIGNGVASFLAANCIGLAIPCEAIDTGTANPKTADGEDFTKVNKNGIVPCLLFSDLSILSGEPTILAFIADKVSVSRKDINSYSYKHLFQIRVWFGRKREESHLGRGT